MLQREKMPLYMTLSAVAAVAVGIIIHRFTDDTVLSALVAVFLVISDYLALRWLLGGDDDNMR